MPGDGSTTATWTFAVAPGRYRVSATWTTYTNRATNAPFMVLDAAPLPSATVAVNQQLMPSGLVDAGANWQDLAGPYQVSGGTLVVRLSNNANGKLNADAIRIQQLPNPVPAPQAQVVNGGVPVADSSGSVNFGTTTVGTPLIQTFTVQNLGTVPLVLTDPISLPAGFSLAADFAATTLSPGGSTTFAVRFAAAAAGGAGGTVAFATNDPANNPYRFTVSATATAAPAVAIVDDSDPTGFSTTGSWVRWTGQGYKNDVLEALPGDGSSVATWTFAVTAGLYRVSATWDDLHQPRHQRTVHGAGWIDSSGHGRGEPAGVAFGVRRRWRGLAGPGRPVPGQQRHLGRAAVQ